MSPSRARPAVIASAVGAVALMAGSAVAGPPASVKTNVTTGGSSKCITLTLNTAGGALADEVDVSLTATRVSDGKVISRSYGQATHSEFSVCAQGTPSTMNYTGFADTNGNGSQDADEPSISALNQ